MLFIAILALASSFFAEYILHISPCFLCWIQRGLWGAILLISILGSFKKMMAPKFCFRLLLVLFAVNFCTASYHTLIQFKIIEDRCMATVNFKSAGDYSQMLKEQNSLGCSAVSWTMAGIPAPLFNAGTCLFLILFRRLFFPNSCFSR